MFRKIRCGECLSLETSLGLGAFATNVLVRCVDCQYSEVVFYGDTAAECELFVDAVIESRMLRSRYKWRLLQSAVSKLRQACFVRDHASGRLKLFALSRMRLRRDVKPDVEQLSLF